MIKAINVPKARKGANGISDFKLKPNFLKRSKTKATTVPIQKERSTAIIPEESPSKYPIPKINLTSPNPISLSFEPREISAKGIARKKPEKSSKTLGTTGPWTEIKIEKKDKTMKARDKVFGITLCLKS